MKIKLDDFCEKAKIEEGQIIDNLPFYIVLENDIPVFYIDLVKYTDFIMSSPKTALQFLT